MNKQLLSSDAINITTNQAESQYFYGLHGSELKHRIILAHNDVNFKTNVNSHGTTAINVYSVADAQRFQTSYENGGFGLGTCFYGVYDAYMNTGFLEISIDSSAFRTEISSSFQITIPITGGTGELSGLTSVSLYTANLLQGDSLKPDGSGVCALASVDLQRSESHKIMHQSGIGAKHIPGINPKVGGEEVYEKYYQSGKMLLWSDKLDFSSATSGDTGGGWSGTSKYTKNMAPLKVATGPNANQAMGVLDLHNGNILLWNADLIGAFDTASATGGTETSGLTFNTSQSTAIMKDRDYWTSIQVTIMAGVDEFSVKGSTNKSLAELTRDTGTCGEDTLVTKVCFYNPNEELMAISSFSTPVVNPVNGYLTAVALIEPDGGEQPNIFDDSTGRVVY